MKALIIVDVQNDFCPGGALEVKNGDMIVSIINQMQHKFDLIIATQDWHPKEHKSFASNHNKNIGEVIDLNGVEQVLWPDHCVQNTKGAEFYPSLRTDLINKVCKKGENVDIDSYSGFYDNDHENSTGLGNYLKESKVTEVYICGLATDYCVKFTALDSVKLGFKTYVLWDACKGVDLNKGDVEKACIEMEEYNIQIINSDKIKF